MKSLNTKFYEKKMANKWFKVVLYDHISIAKYICDFWRRKQEKNS